MNSSTDSQRASEKAALQTTIEAVFKEAGCLGDVFELFAVSCSAIEAELQKKLDEKQVELEASQNTTRRLRDNCQEAKKRALQAEARTEAPEAREQVIEARARKAEARAARAEARAAKAERRERELAAQIKVYYLQKIRRITQIKEIFSDSVVGGEASPGAVSAIDASLPSEATTSAPTIINNYVNGSGCQVFNDNAQVGFYNK